MAWLGWFELQFESCGRRGEREEGGGDICRPRPARSGAEHGGGGRGGVWCVLCVWGAVRLLGFHSTEKGPRWA